MGSEQFLVCFVFVCFFSAKRNSTMSVGQRKSSGRKIKTDDAGKKILLE